MNELHRRYVTVLESLRRRAELAAVQAWQSLGAWNDNDVARFVRILGPTLTGAQRAAIQTTDAYLSAAAGRNRPYGLPAAEIVAGLRGGVPVSETYRRPFIGVWAALAAGAAFETAQSAAVSRLRIVSDLDVALAARSATIVVALREPTLTGWQRVPDPGACPICVAASTQRYHRETLMPIHGRCGCTVAPLFGDTRNLSDSAPADIATHDHGELGPVLTAAGQTFTTP